MKNANNARHSYLLSFCLIGAGLFCLFVYSQSATLQNLILQFLRRNSDWFEEYARHHDAQTYEAVGSSYLRVLIWLTPAWILLAIGLVPFARMCWQRPVFSFILRHSTYIAFALAIMASLCSFGAAMFVTEFQPVTNGDEYGYIFTSKLFASGRLYSTAGVNMEEFSNWAIVTNGPRRYNVHLPGHPLILVLGLLIGNVYVIPSLSAGISVLLVFFIAKTIFSKGTALIAAVLLATSPFYLLFHGTLLPQTTLITCLLLFLLCATKMIDNNKWYWLVIGGSSLSLATFIRPHSVVLFAGPIALYLMLVQDLSARRHFLIAVVGVLAISIGVVALLVYSSQVTGRPISFSLSGLSAHPPGAGPFSGKLGFCNRVGHTPIKGLVNTIKALAGWNWFLFGWPVSFLPIVIWALRRDKPGWEYVFLGSVTCYYIFYFVWHASLSWYYLDTVPLLALVSASTLNKCCGSTGPKHDNGSFELGDNHIRSAFRVSKENRACDPARITRISMQQTPHLLHMLLFVGIGLSVVSWPYAIGRVRNSAAHKQRVFEAIHEANIENNALVLLDTHLHRRILSITGRNSPDLDDDIIFARKLPDGKWHRTVAMFPDRDVYILRLDVENRLVCSQYRLHDTVK